MFHKSEGKIVQRRNKGFRRQLSNGGLGLGNLGTRYYFSFVFVTKTSESRIFGPEPAATWKQKHLRDDCFALSRTVRDTLQFFRDVRTKSDNASFVLGNQSPNLFPETSLSSPVNIHWENKSLHQADSIAVENFFEVEDRYHPIETVAVSDNRNRHQRKLDCKTLSALDWVVLPCRSAIALQIHLTLFPFAHWIMNQFR